MTDKIPFVLELWETGNYYVCSLHDGKKIENLDDVLKLLYLNPKCINTSSLALKPKTKTVWVNLYLFLRGDKCSLYEIDASTFLSYEEAKNCIVSCNKRVYLKTIELVVPCDD